MEYIKREDECCCCSNKEDLFNLLEPYNAEENVEIYALMIAECFRIELSSHVEEYNRNLDLLCKICLFRLKEAVMLRSQIQIAYDRLQAKCYKNNDQGAIEKKEHLLDYNILEYDNIKRENECCCCFSKEDLFSLLEPYNVEENVEIYSTMIAECFQIELSSHVEVCDRNLYLICKNCVFRLKDAIMLRSKIQFAYDRLKDKSCVKDNQGVIKSEYSDIIETKEHILVYDECNMNVDSGASLLNENVLKLRPVKIVLEKIDNNTMENVSIVSVNGKSELKSQPSKIYVCNICTKIFKNSRAIKKHRQKRLNTNENTCEYLKKTLPSYQNVLLHEKFHLGMKDMICDYCKKGFIKKNLLKEHILIHMSIKNVQCDLCDKCFVSKTSLRKHKWACHSVELSCNICGKILRSRTTLEHHVLLHSGVRDQKCEICKKSFATARALNTHKKIHRNSNKQTNHTCKFCNKKCKFKYILLAHEKIHFDIRDLICNYCEKKFRNKRNLTEHILLHMGVKNFKCDSCDKRFVSKITLSSHKRKSHAIRFPCKICGAKFSFELELKHHTLLHSRIKN